MKDKMTTLLWLVLAVLCPPPAFGRSFTGTDRAITTNCTAQSATGQFYPAQATYNVQGYCQVYEKKDDPKGGSTFPVQIDYLFWKAIGTYDAAKYGTTEKVNIYRNDPNSIIATYTAAMNCVKDPWREPGLTCASITFQKVGSLGSYDSEFSADFYTASTTVPMSSLITAQQRAALNQEYQQYVTSHASLKNQPAAIIASYGPLIISPTANSSNLEGRFQVKGTVTGSYTGNELVYVQFTFLGTATTPPPNAFVNIFNISLKDLVNGITVPSTITRGGVGRWQVRAQIFNPNAGPWGAAVTFNLAQLGSTVIPLNKR